MTQPGHFMAAEVAEIPSMIERQLSAHLDEYWSLGRSWAENPSRFFATCARGTSDQAASFFKYLTEIHTGIPVASLGPSLGTVYKSPLRLKDAVLLAISQSGASPDIVALTRAAAEGGAQTIALLNTVESPLGEVAQRVLPLSAGPERAVAATKSFVSSLVAVSAIHAGHTRNQSLVDDLRALPEELRATSQDAFPDLKAIAGARQLFCLGRGHGLALACEAALKFKETCLIGAEGVSTAEFRHGPIASADRNAGALVFLLDDASRKGTEELIQDLRQSGVRTVIIDGIRAADRGVLMHPAVQAIMAITTFYSAIQRLSVDLGLDPDLPRKLVKATLTE